MVDLNEKEQTARMRACIALDMKSEGEQNVHDSLALASRMAPYIGTAKVGKQPHTEAGNAGIKIVEKLYDDGKGIESFFDLKFHDTPNTVFQASKAATIPGVYVFNIHIAGGEEMCKKAVDGAKEAAEARGIKAPRVIGVTVLTSLDDEDLAKQGLGISYDDLVMRRTELAREWGLGGIVCAANKAGALEKRFGFDENFVYVTPGIKWAGIQGKGQKQLYTPGMGARDCRNSIQVWGSAVTKADNMELAAYEMLQDMAKEL